MAADMQLEIQVTFAWWLKPWIFMLVTAAVLSRREPDWDKVERVIARAMRMRVQPKKGTPS